MIAMDSQTSGLSLSSGLRWRLMTIVVGVFFVSLGVSNLDLRQTLSLVSAGWLIGFGLALVFHAEQWMWSHAIGVPLLATLIVDGDQFPHFKVLVGAVLILTAVLGLVSRRWILALAVSGFLGAVLSIASFTKIDYVGAPLIWHDLLVAVRSWDMFLELETAKLAAALLVVLVFPLLWWFEPKAGLRFTLVSALLAAGSAIMVLRYAELPDQHGLLEASFDPAGSRLHDPAAFLFGSLWHIKQLNEPVDMPDEQLACCLRANREAERLEHVPTKLPHVVVVLFESTFDPSAIRSSVKATRFFPQAYPLNVHTIGGSTWVAEYALLHGVAPPIYGAGFPVINLLGPGNAEGRLPVMLRSVGYMTTTIYPVAGLHDGPGAPSSV